MRLPRSSEAEQSSSSERNRCFSISTFQIGRCAGKVAEVHNSTPATFSVGPPVLMTAPLPPPPGASDDRGGTVPRPSSRRDFLSGRALRSAWRRAGEQLAQELLASEATAPRGGQTVHLGKSAMACDFDILLNPGPPEQVGAASAALDLIDLLEDQLSVYRPTSEISEINRRAGAGPVSVEPNLYDLLRRSARYTEELQGAFDLTSGPLIALWRLCRDERRLPAPEEIRTALAGVGMRGVEFDDAQRTVRFRPRGLTLNLGAIGKGYALDQASRILVERGVENFLMTAGGSSLLARGVHLDCGGWPARLQHPILPQRSLATILLRTGRALSSSSAVRNYLEAGGRRHGHLLDPRSGNSADEILAVTVLAETAERAEALSTGFFVLGVEKTLEYCHNHPDVAVVLTPRPKQGRTLQPLLCGLTNSEIFPASPEEQLTFVAH